MRPAVTLIAYGLALLPPVLIAAEQALADIPSWPGLMLQLGVGGVVAVVALKIAQTLYEAKESATKEHHAALLDLTREHLQEVALTRQAVSDLTHALTTHATQFAELHQEIRAMLVAHERATLRSSASDALRRGVEP